MPKCTELSTEHPHIRSQLTHNVYCPHTANPSILNPWKHDQNIAGTNPTAGKLLLSGTEDQQAEALDRMSR